MARTPGSGWGAGTILYQKCPFCNKKKVMYDWMGEVPPFKCTSCRERFYSSNLIKLKYVSELERRQSINLKSAN
jgi:hypothetical protein